MLGKCDAVHSGVAMAFVAVGIVGLTARRPGGNPAGVAPWTQRSRVFARVRLRG